VEAEVGTDLFHLRRRTADFALLDGAANLRKDIVRVRSNQTDRAHDNYENDRQHHRVFRDVLALLIVPELLYKMCHGAPLINLKTLDCDRGIANHLFPTSKN
jgi:hypothetical protein